MREVAVIGVGMTKFGKWLDKSLKDLGREAVWVAIDHAGIDPRDIQYAAVGNSMAGILLGQESIRGQTILRDAGFGGIPIVNVENACASGSTAFFSAWMAVACGLCDVALALGVEKLFCGNTALSIKALSTATDMDFEGRMGISFPGIYAMRLKRHMQKYGTTRHQMALVAVKNHHNGSLNPYAQYRNEVTVEEVLNSRMIADPVTLLMTSPMGDGAAAAILCAKEVAGRYTTKPIYVAATVLNSAPITDPTDPKAPNITKVTAMKAYETAGIGPEDIEVAEVHDAMAPAEILNIEHLQFCPEGEGGPFVEAGNTAINGSKPVNTSGGLAARGHPVAATGLAQICEVVWQLRGEAGARQVDPVPQVGIIQNGGGSIGGETASMGVHILKR